MQHEFDFERLDVYRLAVARWSGPIAEGLARGCRQGANHLRIAPGSAGEFLAALDVADVLVCRAPNPVASDRRDAEPTLDAMRRELEYGGLDVYEAVSRPRRMPR